MIEYEKTERGECLLSWENPRPDNAGFDHNWDERDLVDWYEIELSIDKPKQPNVAQEFAKLVREWKRSTWSLSSVKRRIADPSYLKIIGMGEVVVPLIIKELRHEPDYWSFALEAITRQDPSPEGADTKAIVASWLAWGEARGY